MSINGGALPKAFQNVSKVINPFLCVLCLQGRIRNHAEQGAVTIKVPKGSTESDVIREIKRMASLHHPNIIRLVGIAYGNCGDGSNPGKGINCIIPISEHSTLSWFHSLVPEAPMTWMLMDYASKGDLVDFINYRAGMQLPLDVVTGKQMFFAPVLFIS